MGLTKKHRFKIWSFILAISIFMLVAVIADHYFSMEIYIPMMGVAAAAFMCTKYKE